MANFNEGQLYDTTDPAAARAKFVAVADPRIAASQQHLHPEGSEFLPEQRKIVDEVIQEARDEFSTPFDELYHQQKQVIQDVIEAENALKKKIESLPSPDAALTLDLTKVTPDQRSQVQDLLEDFSSPFTVSQRRKSEQLMSSKLSDLAAGSRSGAYRFDYSETADLQ